MIYIIQQKLKQTIPGPVPTTSGPVSKDSVLMETNANRSP